MLVRSGSRWTSRFRSLLLTWLGVLALSVGGCGSSDVAPTGTGGSGSGGQASSHSGGASGIGGAPGTGGAPTPEGTGGGSATGGVGNAPGSGGSPEAGTGGVVGAGGALSATGGGGGTTAVGGKAGTGGTAGAGNGTGGAAGSVGNTDDVVAPKGGTCGIAWTNPGKQGIHDPSIVKEGDTYYLFRTGGFGFSTSTDKLTWKSGGTANGGSLDWTNNLGLSGSPSIWAPDAHLVSGKAFIYYSVSSWGDVTHSAIGLMTNTSFNPAAPGYKWVDQGKVVGSPEGGSGVNVIDPDLFVDDDGTYWLVYGSFHSGVRLIQLNPQTGMAMTNPPRPTTLTTSLGEGSSLIKVRGYYYLFVSMGHCCDGLKSTYQVVYGRASKVTGPYVNKSGAGVNSNYEKLLAAGQDGNPGQGGQSFFKENGQWYIDYHAYQPPSGNSVLNIRPVYFDNDGWPTFDVCKAKGYTP